MAVLTLLLLLAKSDYVELTGTNVYDYIGGRRAVFTKFYLPTCGHCKAMAAGFAEAATLFTDVAFTGVDCSVEHDLCFRHNATRYPTILLFPAFREEGIQFTGARTVDGFCDFIEEQTPFKSKRPPNYMAELHPLNFNETVNRTKCVFTTFYVPWCGHCKKFLPEAKLAANALLPDADVLVSAVNCDKYREFCDPFVKGFPTIRLFQGGTNVSYNRQRTADDVLRFLNQRCGTQRTANGLLIDDAGLVPEASAIMWEFPNSTDKESFLPRLQAIPEASFYVTVLQRYLAKGVSHIKKDMVSMMGVMLGRKASWEALDGLKKRYNVFAEFFPRTPTPSPPPLTPGRPPGAEDGERRPPPRGREVGQQRPPLAGRDGAERRSPPPGGENRRPGSPRGDWLPPGLGRREGGDGTEPTRSRSRRSLRQNAGDSPAGAPGDRTPEPQDRAGEGVH
jgi:protein disulfide-isomerase A6